MAANKQRKAEERLVLLVMALMASSHGLSKQEILQSVPGYLDGESQDSASVDRKFERDKDLLRRLGIQIELRKDDSSDNERFEDRYLIPRTNFQLPEDIHFTPEEFALLGLAASVWQQATLSGDAQRALTKIRATGGDASNPVIGFAPRLRSFSANLQTLNRIMSDRHLAKFHYRKAGNSTQELRTVEPLATAKFDGRWHLKAFDLDRNDERTFLLSRIVGPVTEVKKPQSSGRSSNGQKLIEELQEFQDQHSATLRVAAGSLAQTVLSKRALKQEGEKLSLSYLDAEEFANELVSFGPEVLVIEPADLAESVQTKLKLLANLHSQRGVQS